MERGGVGVLVGDGMSAHSVDSEGKKPFEGADHELVLLDEVTGRPSMPISGVVMIGVGADDVVGPVMIDNGGRMLNIWSSD